MRFFAPLASILVLAGSIGMAAGDPTCTLEKGWFRNFYVIKIPNVNEDMWAICKRLWKELDDFAGCVVSSPHGCEALKGTKKTLEWQFHASKFCDPGKVEKAIHRANHNGWEENFHCG